MDKGEGGAPGERGVQPGARGTGAPGASVLLSDLPEECLSAVLTVLPVAAVARCAAACSTMHEVAAQDATWRALCLAMPAFAAFAPHAARVDVNPDGLPAGWRQVAKNLKDASAVPTTLQLPGGGWRAPARPTPSALHRQCSARAGTGTRAQAQRWG